MFSMLIFLFACETTTPTEKPEAATTTETAATETAATEVATNAGWNAYGAPFSSEGILPASTVLSAPEKYTDQTVRLEGKVTDVCQKAGCWMVITDDQTTMRVLMKDHQFSVDRRGQGARCQVEGQVIAKKVDPGFVQHMAEESSDPANMPEKQASGDVVYQLIATGVRMQSREG